MKTRAWIKSVTFNDETTVQLAKDDVVVVVGPNNSGKSALLREIRDKFGNPSVKSIVVNNIVIDREGSADDLFEKLNSAGKYTGQPNDHLASFRIAGLGMEHQTHFGSIKHLWENKNSPLDLLARVFCHLLTADERLQAANPAKNIAISSEVPQHPIHFLMRDDALERKLSQQFRKVFGQDLVLHRNAGNQVPIHVGEKPKIRAGQDRVSHEYIHDLEKLPTVHSQGDGMRSLAGVLLHMVAGSPTTLLVDEPEAFLHPPQARHLGQIMVLDRQSDRQLFVATHSGDVLRGMLDSNSTNVRVVRLRRSGQLNIARELDNNKISQVWSDPLLRYSNILDGLFHEKVVVCEADGDCRFYAAVMDALFQKKGEGRRKPDIMFTHCGGKDRLPMVVRSLREIEVPIAVVADFDVLSEEQPLRNIVEAAGGDWDVIANDWREVKTAIDGKRPELNTSDVKREISLILDGIQSTAFPPMEIKKIKKILKNSTAWSVAKTVGIPYVPSGQPNKACVRLITTLQGWAIFIVPVGELESFSKTTGGDGPSWVNEVLKKDLSNDPELENARNFVGSVVGWCE